MMQQRHEHEEMEDYSQPDVDLELHDQCPVCYDFSLELTAVSRANSKYAPEVVVVVVVVVMVVLILVLDAQLYNKKSP